MVATMTASPLIPVASSSTQASSGSSSHTGVTAARQATWDLAFVMYKKVDAELLLLLVFVFGAARRGEHRLRQSGGDGQVFPPGAIRRGEQRLRRSGGVPGTLFLFAWDGRPAAAVRGECGGGRVQGGAARGETLVDFTKIEGLDAKKRDAKCRTKGTTKD